MLRRRRGEQLLDQPGEPVRRPVRVIERADQSQLLEPGCPERRLLVWPAGPDNRPLAKPNGFQATLRHGRGIRLEEGVDRTAMVLIVEQRREHRRPRHIVVSRDPSDDLISNGRQIRGVRHRFSMADDSPNGDLFREEAGTRGSGPMYVRPNHPPQASGIEIGDSLNRVDGRHQTSPIVANPTVAAESQYPSSVYRRLANVGD